MRRRLPSVMAVVLLTGTWLALGCATRSATKPVSAGSPGAAPASAPAPEPATGVAPPAQGAAAESADLVLPANQGTGRFRDLEVTVLEVVEKRKMDGSGMMRATLRLRAGGKDQTVELTSDEPKLEWNGYELEYTGGWRSEVELTIRRRSP